MKRDAAVILRKIHARALWSALRAAGGDEDAAAKVLGISRQELLLLLDTDPAAVWAARPSSAGISGMRRRSGSSEDEGDDGANER